jgi:carboxylesterase 2
MHYSFLLFSATALLAQVDCAPVSQTTVAKPTVTIASGIVIGTAEAVSFGTTESTVTVYNYLGIPFAAQPAAAARFAPPTEPTAWS